MENCSSCLGLRCKPNFIAPFKESGGLCRYIINRIIRVNIGETNLVGITEFQFANQEALKKRHATPSSKRDAQWFNSMVSPHIGLSMEEHIIVGSEGYEKKSIQR